MPSNGHSKYGLKKWCSSDGVYVMFCYYEEVGWLDDWLDDKNYSLPISNF